ncbi:unnamed protein product [Paramecium pentaurelia]|uniref:Uncharacterized protein n=1 Tax=Paramecium pentaurelia TaxID=43138 RepID=A0A8S1VZ82_9CILI|nr:unnamed protein product [Paramecium pentaurelia]
MPLIIPFFVCLRWKFLELRESFSMLNSPYWEEMGEAVNEASEVRSRGTKEVDKPAMPLEVIKKSRKQWKMKEEKIDEKNEGLNFKYYIFQHIQYLNSKILL